MFAVYSKSTDGSLVTTKAYITDRNGRVPENANKGRTFENIVPLFMDKAEAERMAARRKADGLEVVVEEVELLPVTAEVPMAELVEQLDSEPDLG